MKGSYSVRIDKELYDQSVEILNALGLTFAAGVTLFLKQVVQTEGLPFALKLKPTEEEK